MKKLGLLCAAAMCAGLTFAIAPASAQTHLQTCNAEWAAKKADKTVGDQKYKDFRKECLARVSAAPADAPPAAAPAPAPVAKTAAPAARTAAPVAPAPAAAGAAVFPSTLSTKYSSESPGKARMHTCLDQYNENKTANGNGGLHWIQKGGGYYSECNKRLKTT
jgi:hypothetical protein